MTPSERKPMIAIENASTVAARAVGGIAADVNKLTALLNAQQKQIESVADLGAEYSTTLAGQRDVLKEMIRRIRATLPMMVGYRDRAIITYDALAAMVLHVGAIFGDPYDQRIKPPLQQLVGAASQTDELAKRMAAAIVELRAITETLSTTLTPGGVTLDFGDQVMDETSICIPVAGRRC